MSTLSVRWVNVPVAATLCAASLAVMVDQMYQGDYGAILTSAIASLAFLAAVVAEANHGFGLDEKIKKRKERKSST